MRSLIFLLALFISFIIYNLSFITISAHSLTQTVKMTSNGFDPVEISLDTRSTIIFINDDKEAHWPASDVHPTHDIYPEFDPQKPINPGESWPFKPKRVGTFKFHDHLFPHFKGVMIVTGEPGQSQNQTQANSDFPIITFVKNFFSTIWIKIQAIFGQKSAVLGTKDISKLTPNEQFDYFKEMAQSKGVEETWQFLKDTFKSQGGTNGNIHDLAHLTGGLIYQYKGFSGLTICSPEFAFGCYHGFLDKAFEKSLADLEKAEEACQALGQGGPFASCVHGIGHGVASFYRTTKLIEALNSCKRLTTSGQQYCFDGVLMEFERSAPTNFYSKDKPLYPCDELYSQNGPIYSTACGRNQPNVLMDRFKYSFDDVIKVCLSSSDNDFKFSCFDTLGFTLARSNNPDQIISGCQKIADPNLLARCTQAAAGELIFQNLPSWQVNSPKICASLSGEFYWKCQQYLDHLIKDYGKGQKVSFSYKQTNQDDNDYIKSQLKICYDTQGRDGCYKSVSQIFFDQFGLKQSLNLLAENEDYPEVYARCHEVTHFLSRLEYDNLQSVPDVYAQCDSTCHGGCYHGVLEAYLKQKQLAAEDLKTKFASVCGKKEDFSKPLVFNECLHGLGHAAMYVTDLELPQALSLCDVLPSSEFRDRCYSGVFMENSSSSTSNDHPGKFVKADDPFYPCNSLNQKYLPICWQYQSSYFSIISHQDWKKVTELCLKVPQPYQEACFRTIGTNQVGFTPQLQRMKTDCDIVPTQFKAVCVAGVVSSFAYRFVGDSSKMIEFCSVVDNDTKESCYKQMGTGLLDWDSSQQALKTECSKIGDPIYSSWCMNVI